MTKKEKAFSLAELLISLLVTSMVLSATVPTITRNAAKLNEFPFRWVNADAQGLPNPNQQLWVGPYGGG